MSSKLFFFFSFLAICAAWNAFAAPPPPVISVDLTLKDPRGLEILAGTAKKMMRSVRDLFVSWKTIVEEHTLGLVSTFYSSIFMKIHLILTASGFEDTSLNLDADQVRKYRLIAKSLIRLRQRLDTMERIEESIETALAKTNDQMRRIRFTPDYGVTIFPAILDAQLAQQPQLKEEFEREYDKMERDEEGAEAPAPLNFREIYKSKVDIPLPIWRKIIVVLLNKHFLHNVVNRPTVSNKENFVTARSILELSKKTENFAKVQQIYDETLLQVAQSVSPTISDLIEQTKTIFQKLEENFEKSSVLGRELEITKKKISQLHDWDTSVWDLDLIPW